MVIYAPVPAEAAFGFTPQQMGTLDQRFLQSDRWPADPALLIQDSALLLNAFITVRQGTRAWEGRPDQPHVTPRLPEDDWAAQYGLPDSPAREMTSADLPTLLGNEAGVIYTFSGQVVRSFRLRDELDRLELDFLRGDGWPGVHLIRGHALGRRGELQLWRCDLRGVLI